MALLARMRDRAYDALVGKEPPRPSVPAKGAAAPSPSTSATTTTAARAIASSPISAPTPTTTVALASGASAPAPLPAAAAAAAAAAVSPPLLSHNPNAITGKEPVTILGGLINVSSAKAHFKKMASDALIKSCPDELLELRKCLARCSSSTPPPSKETIAKLVALLNQCLRNKDLFKDVSIDHIAGPDGKTVELEEFFRYLSALGLAGLHELGKQQPKKEDGKRGDHGPFVEDPPSPPSKEFIEKAQHAHALIGKLIEDNQGAVQNARDTLGKLFRKLLDEKGGVLDKLQERLTGDERGLLTHALTFLGNRASAGLEEAERRVLSDGGTVSRLMGLLTTELLKQEGPVNLLLERLDARLNAQPDPALVMAQRHLRQFTIALSRPLDEINTEELTRYAILLKESLFPYEKDHDVANALAVLESLDADVPRIWKENLHVFERSLEHLNRLFSERAGLIPSALWQLENTATTQRIELEAAAARATAEFTRQRTAIVEELRQLSADAPESLIQARKALRALAKAIVNPTLPQDQLLELVGVARRFVSSLCTSEHSPLPDQDKAELAPLLEKLTAGGEILPEEFLLLIDRALSAIHRQIGPVAMTKLHALDTAEDADQRAHGILQSTEGLPKRALDRAMGRTPSPPALQPSRAGAAAASAAAPVPPDDGKRNGPPQAPPSAAAPPAAEQGLLDDFLTIAGRFLKGAMGKAQREAGIAIAGVLGQALQMLHARIGADPSSSDPERRGVAILQSVIAKIQEATREGGDWPGVFRLLEECRIIVRPLNVYLFGQRIMQSTPAGVSGAPAPQDPTPPAAQIDAENIDRTKKLLNPSSTNKAPTDYWPKIEEQRDFLVANIRSYAALRMVAEKIANLPPPGDKYYFKIMQMARTGKEISSKQLRKLFFAELDKAPISFFRKLLAKLCYFLIAPIIGFSVKKFFAQLIDQAKVNIAKYAENGFQDISAQTIDTFDGFLSKAIGAHERARNNPDVNNSQKKMFGEELSKPFCNVVGGKPHTPQQLHTAVAKKCAQEFGPTLGWSDHVKAFFSKAEIPLTSRFRFFNPIVKAFMRTLSFLVCTLIFLPELGINALLKWVIKSFLVKNDVVGAVVRQGAQAIQDQYGFSRPLTTMLLKQMKEVWELMTSPEPGKQINEMSTAHQKKLRAVVKNLFHLLKLHAKSSQAEAQEKPSIIERWLAEFDRVCIDGGTDTAAILLGFVLEILMRQNKFEEQLFEAMQLANGSFELGAEQDLAKLKSDEEELKEIVGRIIDKAITDAVQNEFDFSNRRQIQAFQKFSREAQELEERALAQLQMGLQDIFSTTPQNRAARFEAAVVRPFVQFQGDRRRLENSIKTSSLDEEAKAAFERRYQERALANTRLLGVFSDILGLLRSPPEGGTGPLQQALNPLIERANAVIKTIETQSREPIVLPPRLNLLSGSGVQREFVDFLKRMTIERIKKLLDELVTMMRGPEYYEQLIRDMALTPFLQSKIPH